MTAAPAQLEIDAQRLQSEIDALAQISEAAPPVVTRVVFSEADQKARAWLRAKCTEAKLTIREDAVGNMFARWQGADASAPAVATGSHIDAIPNAGKYDGVVGVLGGLEAIRALQRASFRPSRSIELLLFTSEEPTRFGIGCLGSRLLSGTMEPSEAEQLNGADGKSLDQARNGAGFTGNLANAVVKVNHYYAFVELHIEQGPLLEQAGVPLGIVESIAAPASFEILLQGSGGHAGATLMPVRKDALCAAAEVILTIENAAKNSGSTDTVATVGICDVFPGAVNSIPSRVRLTLDLRDTELARRDQTFRDIRHSAKQFGEKRGVAFEFTTINADSPATCSPFVTDTLTRACAKHNLPFQRMVSRAYHDSLFMSRIAPTAMLFIPCHKGYSHRPDEYSSPEDIARGSLILAETLADLSR
jgi:ureidoglycolate amidohydrolase